MLALKSVHLLLLCTLLAVCQRAATDRIVGAIFEKETERNINVCSQDTVCVAGPEYCDIDSKFEQLQNCVTTSAEPSKDFCCPVDKVIGPHRLRRAAVDDDLSDLDDIFNGAVVSESIKPLPEEPGCGVNTKSTSIMNTTNDGRASDWPWMAVFLDTKYYGNFCGGVLLNQRFVLTAAHCFKKYKKDDFVVRLGEYDFSTPNETRYVDHEVSVIRNHPDYDPATHANDISIIKLQKMAVYGPFVRPICLPKTNMPVYKRMAVVIGWGRTSFSSDLSDILIEVTVPVWDHEECVKAFSQPILNTNICAAGYEGDKDSCLGDSGGPLMLQRQDGKWTNIGVVSWGIHCALAEHPGVYTKVTSYLKWISVNTQDYN